ncbi:MAG TPA: hypothetical protein VHI13_08215 [Candidatus Kapabacteria bacterium]|nr:hypothetical protein [Candidatus Kapabacteria bacterium]
MRALTGLALVLLLDVGVTYHAASQWRQIPNTDSTAYAVVSVYGRYVFAGTQLGNMRRSSDEGMTWEPISMGLPDNSILVMLFGELALLLLGTGKGAFRSTDEGNSWQSVAEYLTRGNTAHPFLRFGRRYVIAVVKKYLSNEGKGQVHLEKLPAYAPEVNPDEGVWRYLKHVELRNICSGRIAALRYELRCATKRHRKKPGVLFGCFRHALPFSYQ